MEAEASYVKDTELRLGLPGTHAPAATRGSKRALPEDDEKSHGKSKARVVGWPPIQSYRKNSFRAGKAEAEAAGSYVKVSMDGAPYLRKIDLRVYRGYKELGEALEDMFRCFSLGEASGAEGCTGSEHAMAYEDKDGGLMLVGDVPWEMFISSCKRLRIIKGSEARGLGCRHSDLQRINVKEEVLPVLVDSSKSMNLLKKGRKKKSEKKKKQRKQSLAMKKSENQQNW